MNKLKGSFLILLILVISIVVRLYNINRPIGDWHSWRQADTASVSRNFIKDGFNLLIPKFDDMSSQANTLDNPNRYRFVEFPIYNAVIAGVWQITGVNTTAARATTAAFTIVSTLLIYLIVKKFSPEGVALLSSLVFAVLPYNVFYSTAILPGSFMVFATLSFYYLFIKYLEKEKTLFLVLSIFFANVAVLSWPVAIFFFLPLLYLAYEKYKLKALVNPKLYILAISAIVPFLLWRLWMLKFPEGIPNWQFLLNEGNIRFKGAFFRWIISERLGKLILTTTGFGLFIVGLTRAIDKKLYFYLSILASAILYITIFASGNVRHDYYQVPIVPIVSIFTALGIYELINLKQNRMLGIFAAIFLLSYSLVFGFWEIKGFYWINRPDIVEAGKRADELLPKDAIVIAPYSGDAAFLYNTNRRGYPIVDRSLENLIDNNAKFLVSVEPNDAGIKNLAQDCKVLEQKDKYVIIELFKDCIGK